jgi:Raf kinase inhibitor-like YbhB/YbcL family protein
VYLIGCGRLILGRVAAAAAALAFAAPLAGCGLLGSGITITAPSVMTVSSVAMPRSILPARYTCTAPRPLSPPLNWAGAPSGTKSIALVVDDSNAPISPYVYWVVFNIRPAASAILEGQVPPGARQAKGSAGFARYDPPCPGPHGHGYRFTVYALKTVLNLPNGTSLISAWRAIAAATIGRGRLPVSAASLRYTSNFDGHLCLLSSFYPFKGEVS